MNVKNIASATLSILLIAAFLIGLSVTMAVSLGVIDLSSNPVIDAEQNTTGVPVVEPSNHPTINGSKLELTIHRQVNDRRKAHEVKEFVHSERVRLIARLHSADMAKRDFFNHTNPDGTGPPGRHEMYDGCEMPNENIAMIQDFSMNNTTQLAKEVVKGWSGSEGHNKTQLSDYYHVTGVGVHVTEDRELYVTQNFCREHPNA